MVYKNVDFKEENFKWTISQPDFQNLNLWNKQKFNLSSWFNWAGLINMELISELMELILVIVKLYSSP